MADETEVPPSAPGQLPRVRRRAPTIDLKATEVASEGAASSAADSPAPADAVPPEYSTEPPAYETASPVPPEQPAPPPAPPGPALHSSVARPVAAAGLAGGLAALTVFGVMWLGGALSSPDNSPSELRLASIEARLREMAARPAPDARAMAELAARVERLENAPRPAAASSASIEEAVKPLQAAVADLARRTEDSASAIREARSRADAAQVAAADTARTADDRTDVEALTRRLVVLESASKPLSEDAVKSLVAAGDRPLRAAVAAQALQAAVERGDPFAAELAAAKAVSPNAQALAPLEPFASTGLPSAASLSRALSEVAAAIPKRTASPEPAGGFLERLQSNAEKLVRIRPIDEATGDDPAALVSRAQAKSARGDFAAAVADLNALPASMRASADEWIRKVEARNAAVTASRRAVTDALAALGKLP